MAILKDSGDRRDFGTGAVRDMQEGKGRMDLIPWGIASEFRTKLMTLWNIHHIGTEAINGAYHIAPKTQCTQGMLECMTKMDHVLNPDSNSENVMTYVQTRVAMKQCLLGMAAVFAAYNYHDDFEMIGFCDETGQKEFVNCIFANTMLEVSKHYEDGARKYEDNNWRKGIPVKVYFDSASRHFMKWIANWKDEPHDRAIIWNCLCGAWEADRECTEWAISHTKVEGGPEATAKPIEHSAGSGTADPNWCKAPMSDENLWKNHTIWRDQNGNILESNPHCV